MARIELGPLLNRISGTVGGAVFRGTGKRANLYQRPGGRGGNTKAQTEHRVAMATAFSLWATLTQGEKLAWHNYAARLFATEQRNTPQSNQGQAAFVRWYSVFSTVGETPPRLWPLTNCYNPTNPQRITFWSASPATQLFSTLENREPVGFALYLQPFPQGQSGITPLVIVPSRLRANRIQVWNSRTDGGIWTQVPAFLYWRLDLGTRLSDRTIMYPSGTWFQTHFLLVDADGNAARGQGVNVQKP